MAVGTAVISGGLQVARAAARRPASSCFEANRTHGSASATNVQFHGVRSSRAAARRPGRSSIPSARKRSLPADRHRRRRPSGRAGRPVGPAVVSGVRGLRCGCQHDGRQRKRVRRERRRRAGRSSQAAARPASSSPSKTSWRWRRHDGRQWRRAVRQPRRLGERNDRRCRGLERILGGRHLARSAGGSQTERRRTRRPSAASRSLRRGCRTMVDNGGIQIVESAAQRAGRRSISAGRRRSAAAARTRQHSTGASRTSTVSFGTARRSMACRSSRAAARRAERRHGHRADGAAGKLDSLQVVERAQRPTIVNAAALERWRSQRDIFTINPAARSDRRRL